jgi:hypothetical protein
MPSRRYRKNAEGCLDRAVQARKSEDTDAWLLIAEEWLRLAVESEAAKQQSEDHRNDKRGIEVLGPAELRSQPNEGTGDEIRNSWCSGRPRFGSTAVDGSATNSRAPARYQHLLCHDRPRKSLQ